jgi:hypothetical protein
MLCMEMAGAELGSFRDSRISSFVGWIGQAQSTASVADREEVDYALG